MNHSKKFFLVCILFFPLLTALAQSKVRVLPANVNKSSLNLYAPAISGDGKTIVYLSDYTDDGHHSMYFTTKKSVSSWNEPAEITKLVNRPTLNYRGGYCLSFDGDMLVFTSRKSGLGGFELWYSYRNGANWSSPSNFGRPINSASNEGTPSLSPDGDYLYFMRCDQMTEYKGATGCKLYVAKKKFGKWGTPVELPSNINTGNSQNPKIMADGETLIFSSDQFGGKGGLDLYMSKKEGESWSKPVPMDFMNTDKDDQFISIPAKGRYLYTSQHSGRDYDLVQLLIPEEFRPKKVMRIQGKVTDVVTGEPVNAKLIVFNVDLRDRIWNDNIGEAGEFALVLNEGNTYDLSVNHPDASYKYYSKVYSLDDIGRDKEQLNIQLEPLTSEKEYVSDVLFEQHTSNLADGSIYELRRLADMVRRNPNMKIEIHVTQTNYQEDSVQSNPDLTEVLIDSMIVERQVLVTNISDIPQNTDSLNIEEIDATVDSLNSMSYSKDSTVVEQAEIYETVEELQITYTYHNDRTMSQAEAIKSFLVEKGAKEENLSLMGHKVFSTDATDDDLKQDVLVKIKVIDF